MISKKGFEVQFNWIFVMIAGAAIIAFFTFFIFKYKGISESSAQAEALKSIEAIIGGASVSADTSNIISLPNSDIEVGCNRISIGKASKQYQNLILFAPNRIKGDKLLAQALPFKMPYRSANLLYLTSQQARYIIVGDNALARDINKTLPADLNKEFYKTYDASLIKNYNNYKVRIIFVNAPLQPPPSIKTPDEDLTALRISIDSGDPEKGTLEFYKKSGSSWHSEGTSFYAGLPAIIGAVYSDARDSYSCSMRNSFSRLLPVTKVIKERLAAISNSYPACSSIYSTALPNLNIIETASLKIKNTGLDLDSMRSLKAGSSGLSQNNKDAQKISSSCLIY